MSSYMGDLGNYLVSPGNVNSAKNTNRSNGNDSIQLDMTDFLMLMVTELTNQSIDQTADTSDMLNQMVQMQMVQAMVNMTDASLMSYAASLVGKEITVGQYDGNGKLQEIYGTVTGTGTMNGQQVVFVNDKYYYMNEIMAVGKLPKVEDTEDPKDPDKTEDPKDPDKTEDPKDPDKTENTGGTESGGSGNKDEAAEPGAAEQ